MLCILMFKSEAMTDFICVLFLFVNSFYGHFYVLSFVNNKFTAFCICVLVIVLLIYVQL